MNGEASAWADVADTFFLERAFFGLFANDRQPSTNDPCPCILLPYHTILPFQCFTMKISPLLLLSTWPWLATAFVAPTQKVSTSLPSLSFRLEGSVASDDRTTTTTASSLILPGLTVPPISPFGQGMPTSTSVASSIPPDQAKHFLGGKGANLAQMSSMGLAVPPGFTLTTECCALYTSETWQQQLPDALWEQVLTQLAHVEKAMGCDFGSPTNPLLLSVRSGAAIR